MIGFTGIFGMDFYDNYKHSQNLEARSLFLENKTSDNENYNVQKSLIDAKNKVLADDYQGATKVLQDVNTDNILQDVKNIALAKIYAADKKFDDAVNLLENNTLASSKHLLADIYLAQGKTALALETYKLALQSTQNSQIKALIEIKINDIK